MIANLPSIPGFYGLVNASSNQTYTQLFPEFTNMTFVPEFAYYNYRAGMEGIPVTLNDTFTYATTNGIFNLKIIQDCLLDFDASNPFNVQQFRNYSKYATY